MAHDFAKIRPGAEQETQVSIAQPSWALLFTGLFTGLALGVFGCFLIYLSGVLPPVPDAVSKADAAQEAKRLAIAKEELQQQQQQVEEKLQLDFYDELPRYEVEVNAIPLQLKASSPTVATTSGNSNFMLKVGVFHQRQNAIQRQSQLSTLGLEATISEEFVGQTRYVVQMGPYSRGQLDSMRDRLRQHGIDSAPALLL